MILRGRDEAILFCVALLTPPRSPAAWAAQQSDGFCCLICLASCIVIFGFLGEAVGEGPALRQRGFQ